MLYIVEVRDEFACIEIILRFCSSWEQNSDSYDWGHFFGPLDVEQEGVQGQEETLRDGSRQQERKPDMTKAQSGGTNYPTER